MALSLLLSAALTGCSSRYRDGDNDNNSDDLARRYNIYYEFSQNILDKAVEASATHVAGFAYDDKGQQDAKFAIEETEIAKMQKAENGDYIAELNVSGYVKYIELYFYYKEGDEKLATNCKYIRTDFASLNRDGDIIIDCDADDAYFTIKTYDSMGQETSRFTPGDQVYAKVFVTWQGDDYFYVPAPTYDSVIIEDRTLLWAKLSATRLM